LGIVWVVVGHVDVWGPSGDEFSDGAVDLPGAF
jgi:hypothetical protein